MKKIISVVLCVMLLFSAVSFTAFAGEDKTDETTETNLPGVIGFQYISTFLYILISNYPTHHKNVKQ